MRDLVTLSHRRLQVLLTLAVTAVTVTARPSFHEGHGLGTDEPKLISQSVHLHEVPTKVIKVIKTVAIKVPVPYPVKVGSFREKVRSCILIKRDRLIENASIAIIRRHFIYE